jgi:hypothetical protein
MGVAPAQATITRRQCEHDSASLFVNTPTRSTDFDNLPDQRVEFDFGVLGMRSTFQGYVTTVMPQQRLVEDQQVTLQEITCLGASMVMKGNTPRFFTELTLTEMMRRIVSDANLGFSDEFRNDNTIWRTLAQTSETDWEMVVTLADRLGAVIIYERGVIRLVNYLDVAYRQLPSQFLQMATLRSDALSPPGTVVDFVPSSMSARDPSYRTPTLSYLSGKSAVLVEPPASATQSRPGSTRNTWGSAVVSRFATSMPALSAQEAQAIQRGYYNPPWNQEAEIRIIGDARAMPGTTVQVSSSLNGPTLTPTYDGVWYVKQVEHQMDVHNKFFTTLTLGRAQARASNWYPPQPFWLNDPRQTPTLRPSGSGQWISNWR